MSLPKLTGKWSTGVGAATLTSIVAASQLWSTNNPGWYDVHRMRADDCYSKADLFVGSVKGCAEAGAVAFGTSMLVKSWWPLAGTAAYLAVHWAFYNWAFNSKPSDMPQAVVRMAEDAMNEGDY